MHCKLATTPGPVRPYPSAAGISWYAFALEYMEMSCPLIEAKTRDEINDALCAITRAMPQDVRGSPER
ncbi:hypothetical protein GCM10023084_10170 [Streptomyces lacrimifluminis]|uniref:Uncharacterized protein n=1 Tax=Streptomyces lacrimifluminis TaxID=1500077 RepID=A0A917L7R8_9ACTN|nr:hypothetical protein GCM10012282_49330 [Streptomyces lacrimifluminis]